MGQNRFLLYFPISLAELPPIIYQVGIQTVNEELLPILKLEESKPQIILSSESCATMYKMVSEFLRDSEIDQVEIPTLTRKFLSVREEIMQKFRYPSETRLIILIGHWRNEEFLNFISVETEEKLHDEQFFLLDLDQAKFTFTSPVFASIPSGSYHPFAPAT